ncbi:MAG: GGDEF domain-containing protein [Pseudolabrys sp.]|nr:GGDEF domain-containing protein [Pseudolabrys sp.]MBV9259977.1 GGDEF domain-containing protein [Pseudolabrys sp.]
MKGAPDQTGAPLGPAALLLAEIERLKHDLDVARAKIGELEARADVDPLLDILNRRGFERELKRALAYIDRYGTLAALIYIDLDGFKTVNDRHGHAAGDALLTAVAQRLTGLVRASDIVARLGGDEFAVLIWNAPEQAARVKARELETAVCEVDVPHAGEQLSVGASAGVAMLGKSQTPGAILHAADQAMYARKRERRG